MLSVYFIQYVYKAGPPPTPQEGSVQLKGSKLVKPAGTVNTMPVYRDPRYAGTGLYIIHINTFRDQGSWTMTPQYSKNARPVGDVLAPAGQSMIKVSSVYVQILKEIPLLFNFMSLKFL